MEKGIIYKAYNKSSGKYYIGQTFRNLKTRIAEHYSASKSVNSPQTHFMNALRFYDKETWDWSIIENVDKEKMNVRERYWIIYYDSFENGYNGNYGGVDGVKPGSIHSLYHPDYGVVEAESKYFVNNHGFYPSTISQLKSKKSNNKSFKGWVLSEHKDNYIDFLRYNPKHNKLFIQTITEIAESHRKENRHITRSALAKHIAEHYPVKYRTAEYYLKKLLY